MTDAPFRRVETNGVAWRVPGSGGDDVCDLSARRTLAGAEHVAISLDSESHPNPAACRVAGADARLALS